MSTFSAFMAGNAVKNETVKYVASKRFVEKGKPIEWEIKAIDSDLDEALRKDCTKRVPIVGKRGQYNQETGEDIYFDMQISNQDVTASDIGRQTVILYDCNFDSVILAAFDADSDDTLTESMDFTAERFELPEKFKHMDGMK